MGLGLGPFEIILTFAVTLLMFGAKRLPELASGMGRGIRGFKRALHGADDDPPFVPQTQQHPDLTAPALIPADLTAAAQPAAPDVDQMR